TASTVSSPAAASSRVQPGNTRVAAVLGGDSTASVATAVAPKECSARRRVPGGPGAGTAAAGAAGLCGLGVVVAGGVSAEGVPVVGDGGHQLVRAAEPGEGRAQAGEVVHQRFEEPARAGADDDLGVGVA